MRFLSLILLALCVVVDGQTTSSPGGTVLRLRVRVKVGSATRGLARKRFYLVRGSLAQNKTMVEEVERRALISRECFYRSAGASDALLKWLAEGDCETVYCREVSADDVSGVTAVPEFVAAVAAGEKQFGSAELARKWVTINLPDSLRNGFYQVRQNSLGASLKQAEETSGAKVLSVMTDRNGTAYFTDLQPGVYTLSSILPSEIGNMNVSWNCELQVKADERGFEKPYLLSNRNDKNVKCVGVEKPLPVCESANK